MIAIISSCIYPEQYVGNAKKSYFTVQEREQQTLDTIRALKKFEFSQIILVDNSITPNLQLISDTFTDITVLHIKQFQFGNKGINELLMLLATLDLMKDDEPIFKISGRYLPNENFVNELGENNDLKVKMYNRGDKQASISTRGYFVRNKKVYQDFLLKTLHETFAYPQRVVGVRSFLNFVKQLLRPSFATNFGTGIEFAAARVLKYSEYHIQYVEEIGIGGVIAGFEDKSTIKE